MAIPNDQPPKEMRDFYDELSELEQAGLRVDWDWDAPNVQRMKPLPWWRRVLLWMGDLFSATLFWRRERRRAGR